MNAVNESTEPLGGTFPSATTIPCVEAGADPLSLFGHPDLVGIMAGFSLAADWGAPVPTPTLDPEEKVSLQDLTNRVNVLLRAQALTLAAVAELLEVARAAREGGAGMNTTTASKRTRTTRPREIPAQVPASTRPSERVLQRLLALANADGFAVRTIEEDELHGYGAPPAVTFDPNTQPEEQSIDLAWSLGFQRMRTTEERDLLSMEPQGLLRVERFTVTLLANLYAAEALALPVD